MDGFHAVIGEIKFRKVTAAVSFRLASNMKQQSCMRAMSCHHDATKVEAIQTPLSSHCIYDDDIWLNLISLKTSATQF